MRTGKKKKSDLKLSSTEETLSYVTDEGAVLDFRDGADKRDHACWPQFSQQNRVEMQCSRCFPHFSSVHSSKSFFFFQNIPFLCIMNTMLSF